MPVCRNAEPVVLGVGNGEMVDVFCDVVANPKDTHLLTGSQDGKLCVYDLMRKNPVKSIQAHSKVLSAISVH